ncbi:MAG TPA: acyl-CoA dehydrogenase family protein [Candidatus Bathyarchaeia archaeon]|nr:acyl-CoA dehydrogenase family protein [Candidatus Bathyarchaeia archaeon]
MSLQLTRPEQEFQRRVRAFASKHIVPIAEEVERGLFPREVLEKLGRQHLLGAAFPKADGGLGLGWTCETIVAEEVSAVSAATEMARLASVALYAAPLAYFANKEQKRQYLRPVLAGEKIGALALTEPKAGSDTSAMRTLARRKSGYYVVNGQKRFITNGGVADYLFVFAVTDPKKPAKSGVSGFVIPRQNPGVKIIKSYGLLGMKGANVAQIEFRNVKVPSENLVGGYNRGFKILLDELDRERPAVGAGMIGIARAAFEAAVHYSSVREQFGRPINRFEGVSFRIAEMAVELEASRLLILQAARLLDQGKRATKEGALAKLYATEAAFNITHQALQVHGGIGYTTDLPVERYFRDARFMMIGGGTSEIMKYIIQREVYREKSR